MKSVFEDRGGLYPGEAVLHVSKPYLLKPGYVYVVDDDWWKVVKGKGRGQRVIVCSRPHCHRPARKLDHFYPYASDFNLCEVHA